MEIINHQDKELRQIPNYSKYFVDDCGTIYHRKGDVVVEQRARDDHRGYLIVPCLRDDGVSYPLKVHHAVLNAFVGPRPTPTHVTRHLDDNSCNNKLDNLAWGTQKENQKDKLKNAGTIVDKRKTSAEKRAVVVKMAQNGFTSDEIALISGWKKDIVAKTLA